MSVILPSVSYSRIASVCVAPGPAAGRSERLIQHVREDRGGAVQRQARGLAVRVGVADRVAGGECEGLQAPGAVVGVAMNHGPDSWLNYRVCRRTRVEIETSLEN